MFFVGIMLKTVVFIIEENYYLLSSIKPYI